MLQKVEYLSKRARDIHHKTSNKWIEQARNNLKRQILVSTATIAAQGGALAYFCSQAFAGNITAGDLAMLIAVTTQFSMAVSGLSENIGQIDENARFAKDFFEIQESSRKVIEEKSARKKEASHVRWDLAPPEICFENVCFRYPNAKRNALENINLTIKPGEFIAIIGENGSGKTTLLSMLSKIYAPTSGSITLDGISVDKIPEEEIRTHMGELPQEYAVMRTFTVRELLEMGKKGKLSIEEAARITGLDGFLTEVAPEKGFDAMLGTFMKDEQGDEGIKFSGGGNQILMATQAQLSGGRILVLDEPTSQVDDKREEAFFQNLAAHRPGEQTRILISHDMANVSRADRIIVMDKGRIIEMGTPGELLKIPNSRYRAAFMKKANIFIRKLQEVAKATGVKVDDFLKSEGIHEI